MRVSVLEVPDQKAALGRLVDLVEKNTADPLVRNAAIALTSSCDERDDECEVHAIFNAVKHGDDRVKGLEHGVKYMSDPQYADFFTSPSRMLKQLADGYNAGDCDDQSTLVAALLGAIGFTVGLRVWGKNRREYTHVYAVVGMPKLNPHEWWGLDTTVDESEPGWEPPGGVTLTAIADGS